MSMLSNCFSTVKFYIKFVGLHLSYICLTALCGLFALYNPGSSKNLYIAQFFQWLMRIEWWYGFDIQVENWDVFQNIKGPVIIISNHQSVIDALIMLKTSPNGTAVLAKRSLLFVPIFGIVSWLYGTIFIDRSKGKSAIEMMKNVGIDMKTKNTSVWIFAEGTRRQRDKVMDFKKGAFHLAVQGHIPIVPVVIGNYRNVLDVKNRQFGGGVIRMKHLAPINTDGLKTEDVNDLMAKVHKIISDGFEEDYKNHAELYKDLIPMKAN